MIEIREGNLFEAVDAEAIVNATNCVGVMGPGISKAFSERFPWCVEPYRSMCATGRHKPGNPLLVRSPHPVWPPVIIHVPTKRHWRERSRLEDVYAGLVALQKIARAGKLHRVALPPLGCGLGGLNWNVVRGTMQEVLGPCGDVLFVVVTPGSARAE